LNDIHTGKDFDRETYRVRQHKHNVQMHSVTYAFIEYWWNRPFAYIFIFLKINEYAKRKLFVLFCLSIFVLFLMLPFLGGIVYIIILFKLSSAPITITMCLAEDSRYKAIVTIQLLDWAVFYWLAGLLKLAKSPYLWCEKKQKLTSKYYSLMDVQYRIARMSTTQEYTSQPFFSGCYCLPIVHCFNASPRFDLLVSLVGIHITQ